jgi:MYXO-CTERM domain-containing protein
MIMRSGRRESVMLGAMRTLLVACLLVPGFARADVMTPEHVRWLRAPRECPAGASPVAGEHGDTGRSPHCTPTTCSTDAECANDTGPCREIGLCIERRPTYGPPTPSGEPETYALAHGPCGADGACATGTCETATRCAGAAPPPDTEEEEEEQEEEEEADESETSTTTATPPTASRGCACSADSSSLVPLALTALGLALLLGRRRR